MNNLDLYSQMATTPKEAKKTIAAGRLKGFTDIQPMYRIKKLTEVFGPCGIGWKYVIKSQRIEAAPNGELKAFMDIDLYYKWNGEWSEPIPGIGGNAFLSHERSGDYVNDECFKSALSDAIGTACKAIGMCADVYYAEDRTKYFTPPQQSGKPATSPAPKPESNAMSHDEIIATLHNAISGVTDAESANRVVNLVKSMHLADDDKKTANKLLTDKTNALSLVYTKSGYVRKG